MSEPVDLKSFGHHKPLVFVISGIISVGKSTLIKTLSSQLTHRGYRVVVVAEPVQKWVESGMLKTYYDDVARYGYLFQTNAFVDRIQANRDAWEQHGNEADVYLLERSCVDDRTFMELLYESGNQTDLEFATYQSWATLHSKLMPYEPDAFIYMRPTIDETMRRIKLRSRDGESAVSLDYQLKLQEKHDVLFGSFLDGSGTVHRVVDPKVGTDTTVVETMFLVNGVATPCFRVSTDEDFREAGQAQAQMTGLFEHLIELIRQRR